MTTISPVKVTFERILVPTDFSAVSRRAVEYAKSIAKQANSELLLVHVNQPANPVTPPEAAWIDETEILERQQEQLEQSGAALRAEGFRAEAISVTGPLQDRILSEVKNRKVDLIVLGTHGRGGLERLLLGSDAEAVLRHAPCPVLAIGPAVPHPTQTEWCPRGILCASTLEASAAGIAAYAYSLAMHYGAQFVLFHVEGAGRREEVDWDAFERAFRRHLPEAVEWHPSLQTWLTSAKPGAGIVDAAKQCGADLLVMGAHTASTIATHLASGTAPKVLAQVPCPVMTIQQS